MTATFYVGDVLDVLGKLPENSVDLVLSSPPFLNLRSYLPADHPNKFLEGGSQSSPGEYVDWLIDVVEACDRVLAPHGSLCFELGDNYSGSGGAGGDYSDDGWRNGQPKFGGSASRTRTSSWSFADAKWLAGVIDTEGSIHVHKTARKPNPSYVVWVRVTMMDREVCDRAALITGVGSVTQDKRGAYTWAASAQQARYVLLHIWPHLLIKQRQAKACIELARHTEEEERRGRYAPLSSEQLAYRQMIKDHVSGWNFRGEQRGTFPTSWEPPTPPHIRSAMMAGPEWAMAKSLSLVPELFRFSLVYGFNPFTGRQTERWRLRNVIRWVRPNPPVGALGDKFRPATSELMVFCKSAKRYFDLDAVREPGSSNTHARLPKGAAPRVNTAKNAPGDYRPDGFGSHKFVRETDPAAGAPPLDWWKVPQLDGNEEAIERAARALEVHLPDDVKPYSFRFVQTVLENYINIQRTDAPPLDWWNIPPGGYEGAHYAVMPKELCVKPIKAMCPEKVCRTCGEPQRPIREHLGRERYADRPDPKEFGRNLSAAMDELQIGVDYLAEQVGVTPWMVRHWRAETPTPQVPSIKRWDQIAAVLGEVGEWGNKMRVVAAEYGTPDRGNREIPERLSGGPLNGDLPKVVQTGFTDCGHDDYRPGVVLDCFVGSGTTLSVASGHGRDSIGIDLDERNWGLALERVGPLMLQRGEIAAV